MFNTTVDFKIGKLENLEKQNFEIIEENELLNFHIEGEINNNYYTLDFTSTIPLDELLKINLNEHVDFMKYVDDGDIVFGKNGKYDLNVDIKMDLMRYIPSGFLLVINFKDRDNMVGMLELSFSFDKKC